MIDNELMICQIWKFSRHAFSVLDKHTIRNFLKKNLDILYVSFIQV